MILKKQVELTVGDLSIAKERQRHRDLEWIKKPINNDSDVTIGDLSIAQKDNRGLDESHEDPKASDIKPCTSESQRLQWELNKDWREKQQKVQGIKVGNR